MPVAGLLLAHKCRGKMILYLHVIFLASTSRLSATLTLSPKSRDAGTQLKKVNDYLQNYRYFNI